MYYSCTSGYQAILRSYLLRKTLVCKNITVLYVIIKKHFCVSEANPTHNLLIASEIELHRHWAIRNHVVLWHKHSYHIQWGYNRWYSWVVYSSTHVFLCISLVIRANIFFNIADKSNSVNGSLNFMKTDPNREDIGNVFLLYVLKCFP